MQGPVGEDAKHSPACASYCIHIEAHLATKEHATQISSHLSKVTRRTVLAHKLHFGESALKMDVA